jgi:hypothetical protein
MVIPGNKEYVVFHNKMEFSGTIKVTDLKIIDNFGLSRWAQSNYLNL